MKTIDLVREQVGADLFATDHQGRSILHYAAWRGNVAVMRRVVELGGVELLRRADASGRTPLYFAMQAGAALAVNYVQDMIGSASPICSSIVCSAKDAGPAASWCGDTSGSIRLAAPPQLQIGERLASYLLPASLLLLLLSCLFIYCSSHLSRPSEW